MKYFLIILLAFSSLAHAEVYGPPMQYSNDICIGDCHPLGEMKSSEIKSITIGKTADYDPNEVESTPAENLQARKDIITTLASALRSADIPFPQEKTMLDCPHKKHGKTEQPSLGIAIGINAHAEGGCSIVIGANLTTPKNHPDNFVNIGNKLCFDAATGKRLKCPAKLRPEGK